MIEIKCPQTNLIAVIEWKEIQTGSFFAPVYKNPVKVEVYKLSDFSDFSSQTALFSNSLTSSLKPNTQNPKIKLLKELRGKQIFFFYSAKINFFLKGEAGEVLHFYENDKKGEIGFTPDKNENKISVLPKENRLKTSSLEIWGKLSDSIVAHDLKLADQQKRTVEEEQRRIRKQREINKEKFLPSYFTKRNGNWNYHFDQLFIPHSPQN